MLPGLGLLVSPIGRWVAVGAVVAALGAAIWIQSSSLDAAALRATVAREAAEANAAVAKQLQADAERANAIVAEREARIAELEGRKAEIIREIIRVPVTAQCVSSPAVGAALGGLRNWPAAHQAGDGRAKAAVRPDRGVPPASRARRDPD
jgi:hypothetical protein